MPSAWSNAVGTLAAPWQLAGLCGRRTTWHTIGGAAEIILSQCHGGLMVLTPAGDQDPAVTPDAPVALRSLIQLDGDVLLMVDPGWLARQDAQALKRALARHQAQIAAAVEPLRQGFDTASEVMILAARSRWSVLGLGGLLQGGAVASAASLSASSWSGWLGAALAEPWVVLPQALSLVLFGLFGGTRLVLRCWIRRKIGTRLTSLIQQSGK